MGATRSHKIHLITVLIDLLSLAPAPTSFSLNNILSSHQIKLMRLSCTFPLTKFPNKNLMSKNFPICMSPCVITPPEPRSSFFAEKINFIVFVLACTPFF